MEVFSPLLEQAIELAAQWHDGTYRKSRWRAQAFDLPDDAALEVPVAAHVTTVALTVQRAGWDEAAVAAAFLHDVLEDGNRFGQRFRRAQLRQLMGDTVVLLVDTVSEPKLDADGKVRPWKDRKVDYIAQLREGPTAAVAISLADKLHNLWTMNENLARGIDIFSKGEGRRALSAGPEKQVWFFESVLEASLAHTDDRLGPMRTRLQQELERFITLTKQIAS